MLLVVGKGQVGVGVMIMMRKAREPGMNDECHHDYGFPSLDSKCRLLQVSDTRCASIYRLSSDRCLETYDRAIRSSDHLLLLECRAR